MPTTEVSTWYRPLRLVHSQEVSRRNARVAVAVLLTRRQEREDAEHFAAMLAEARRAHVLNHSVRQSSQS